MAMAETVKYITNNTGHIIMLPPIAGNGKFPEAIRLIPGLNRIPAGYLEAAYARTQPVCDEYGKPITRTVTREREVVVKDNKGNESVQKLMSDVEEPVMRFPLKTSIERLFTEKVRIVTSQGKSVGERLTLHADGTIDENAPLGPPPPLDLPSSGADGRNSAALFMIANCSDRDALVRWAAEDMREEVRRACGQKLGTIA